MPQGIVVQHAEQYPLRLSKLAEHPLTWSRRLIAHGSASLTEQIRSPPKSTASGALERMTDKAVRS